ncbi:MAG: LTA synthase family protein [Flavobacteriales bacterium]
MLHIDKGHQFFLLALKRVGLAFLISTLCRVIFYIFNLNSFDGNIVSVLWHGLRFDSVSISYFFSLFILLSILPIAWQKKKWYQNIVEVSFYLGAVFTIIPNIYDTISYHFTLKRSTADVIKFAATGDEAKNVALDFMVDSWYLVLITILLFWLTIKLYRKTKHFSASLQYNVKQIAVQFGFMILGLGLLLLGARGGLELKPINIIEASRYVQPKYAPLVLNTPFTIAKTYFQESIQPKSYFSKEEVNEIYEPKFTVKTDVLPNGKNVMVIILESFAKEYVGYFNDGRNFTPFLDSLMEHSLVYTDAYANGQQSMDAVPAIFGSLPDLMNRPYILSSYSSNVLPGIGTPLNNAGYETSFYHGGKNGTMGFDGLINNVGIKKYNGLNEYPPAQVERDTDGKWGIYDGPYFSYLADDLAKMKQPFFSSVFSLSSHFPYTLPKGYENRFPKGEHEIMELVAYADDALKQFFKKVKTMDWYMNTLFVITADHTAQPIKKYYKSKIGKYAIPMVLFTPDQTLKGKNNKPVSHVDILPTVLDYVQLSGDYFTFGSSMLGDENGFVIHLENGAYQYVDSNYVVLSNGKSVLEFHKRKSPEELQPLNVIGGVKEDDERLQEISKKISAYIQQYNNSMLNNKLFVRESK